MDEGLIKRIEKLYGLQIYASKENRDVFRLDTNQGSLCLKEIDYQIKKFLFIYAATEYLLRSGFQRLPAFIHTLSGDPFFQYQKKYYSLSQWLEGRESDFKDLSDLEMALVTLAQLHQASQGFHLPTKLTPKSRLGIWPQRFQERVKDLNTFKELAQSKSKQTSFDKYYLKHVDTKIQEGEMAYQLLKESAYDKLVQKAKKNGGLCHNDFVYHNVLMNDTQPAAYIIDFDYCRHDLRVYDLARLLRRLIKKGEQQTDLLDVVLTAYNSVSPLLSEEYPILAAFLQFPQRFWRMADRYYHQRRDWSEKKYYSRLKRAVRRFRHRKSLVKEILDYEKKTD